MSQEGPPPGQGIPMATAAGSIHQQQAAAAAQLSPTLFSRAKLYEIVNSISYGERLEPSVEYALLKIAEAFVLEVAGSAADLARHRKSRTIEPKDILFHLEREWDMTLPGFTDDENRANFKLSHPTVAHQTRSAHATRAAFSAHANLPRPS